MIRHLRLVLVVALLAWSVLPGTATAQNRGCVVEQAPAMNFGRPGANPTAEVRTVTGVTVRCTGNPPERGKTVLVCLKLDPSAGQTTLREMASGTSRLGYQIRAASFSGPIIALTQTADGTLTMDQGTTDSPSGATTIQLYGSIIPGQSGLGAGIYAEAIRGELRSTTEPLAGCSTTLQAVVNTSATATLPGSCSIVADDLAFGSHSSLGPGGINGTAAIRLVCTDKTAYAVRIDGGSSGDPANRRMRRNGTGPQSIIYGLYRDSSRTQPWGNTPSTSFAGIGNGLQAVLTAYGLVPAQPQPLSGNYQDTVTVTVEY